MFEWKKALKESTRVALMVFLICFAIAFLISMTINLGAKDLLQSVTIGKMGDDGGTMIGRIVRGTLVVMNVALFNHMGQFQVGILIFAAIPVLAFFISRDRALMLEGLTLVSLVRCGMTSLFYTVLLTLLSWITQGTYLGMYLQFASLRNFFMTLIVTFLIQLLILMNYNKNAFSFVRATRMMFRMMAGAGLVLAIVDMVKLFGHFSFGILEKIGAAILLLPNMIIYKAMLLMGTGVEASETFEKALFEMTPLTLNFSQLGTGFKVAGLVVFVIMTVVALLFLEKEEYLMHMGIFSLLFPVIMTLLMYCASIDLGEIIFVGKMYLGANWLMSFLIPFVMILVVGLTIFLIRKMIEIVLSEE